MKIGCGLLIMLNISFIAQSVFADFVGLEVIDITENTLGLKEFAIYAQFDEPGDELISVQLANITSSTGFFHNTINGGNASALPFTTEQTAISDHPDADSFVTIGLMTGDNNPTCLGPFDEEAFFGGNSLGANAVWGNCDPFIRAGLAGDDGLVLIAVFTPLNDMMGNAGIVMGSLTVGYGSPGQGALFADASFTTIPAPGALPLLGLAALLGRSRRRGT